MKTKHLPSPFNGEGEILAYWLAGDNPDDRDTIMLNATTPHIIGRGIQRAVRPMRAENPFLA